MSGDWIETTDIQNLSDWAFMKLYSSPYNHDRQLKARLDQEALGIGYKPRPHPTRTDPITQERGRRGLVYPDSWIAAGILTEDPRR